MSSINETYKNDLKEVNSYYDDKINTFLVNAKKSEVYLFESHRQELENYENNLENSIPKKIKFSKNFLDLKKRENAAAKSENFVQANYFRKQCEILEKEEKEKFLKNRKKKILNLVNKMKEKHNKEKQSLKQKLDREYEKILAEKRIRIDYTIQNYNNKKRNAQNDFNKTINIFKSKKF